MASRLESTAQIDAGAISAATQPTTVEQSRPAHSRASIGLIAIRYGIGAVMVLGGIVTLVVSPAGLGVDGFAMAVGGGLAVLLLNFLYRLGVSGDLERTREEQARSYLEEHGEWPADEQRSSGRKWTLAPGVATPEDEAAERDRETRGVTISTP